MNLKEYIELKKCNFIDFEGTIKWYWSNEERSKNYNYQEINDKLCKQLTCNFDYNNCVILFPLACGGTSCLFNQGKVVIDHCTYPLDIVDFLNSKNVEWEGGILKSGQHLYGTTMIIVENGVAKLFKKFGYHDADPTQKSKEVGDKKIFFSGFLVNRIRNNKITENNLLRY